MTDAEKDLQRIQFANERYHRAMHSVQCAVGFELDANVDAGQFSPKHIRVGINSSMVNDSGLASLLLAKGVFTLVEYHEAMAEAAEREQQRYAAKHPHLKFI